MKKIGLLNHQISEIIAKMGHTDSIVIADAGLPIPPGVLRIDLALVPGTPGYVETLRAVLTELQVEEAVVAAEMEMRNGAALQSTRALLGANVRLDMVPHSEFKALTRNAVAVIRTGECSPYANVILRSGVIF